MLQLLIGLTICLQIAVIKEEEDNKQLSESEQMLVLFNLMVCVGFTLFVAPLVVFHTYLISINLTSWEFLSWSRITYLLIWPRKYGSPFSYGVKSNLQIFFCGNFTTSKTTY